MVANERGGEQMELSLGFWLSDDVVVQVSIDVANFFFIFYFYLDRLPCQKFSSKR